MVCSLYKIPGELHAMPDEVREIGNSDPSVFLPFIFLLDQMLYLPEVDSPKFRESFLKICQCFPDFHVADMVVEVPDSDGVYVVYCWGIPCWFLIEE